MQNRASAILFPLMGSVLYGFIVALFFTGGSEYLEALSWSFIMLLPYAVGALGIYLLINRRETKTISLVEAIFLPWLFLIALCVVVIVASLGMLFCIVIGAPLLFPAASLGGTTTYLLMKNRRVAQIMVLLAMLAPIFVSPVEAQVAKPASFTTTHTFIDIVADTETVWDLIKSVEPITESEHRLNWLHWVGLPRPVAATLSHEGIGGVRDATFENGLRFDETITEWEHHKRISFSIVETSEELLPPPLDLIDGERFDVLYGTYELEHLDEDTIRLHLTSEHYLGTRFNQYGAFWTGVVMRNLQNYILEVIHGRAEA